jgi:hypothetical protein
MSEWIAITQWETCRALERPGIAFEIRNAQDQRLFTRCEVPLPAMPHGWRSPPTYFRIITEPPAQRSEPMPEPSVK